MVQRKRASGHNHRIRGKDSTADAVMPTSFGMELLLAAAVAYAEAFCDEALTDSHIASAVSSPESRVTPFDESLVSDETGATVLVGQIRPDDVVEHVVFHGRYSGR